MEEDAWIRPGRAQPEIIRSRLTPRELEILGLISNGYSTGDISLRLGISIETVKSHVKHILARLNAKTRAHAVARGFQLDLLTTDSLARTYVPSGESLYE